jgi:hypothetical protein
MNLAHAEVVKNIKSAAEHRKSQKPALSGNNGLKLLVESGWILQGVLTFSKPPSPEAVPNFICKPQPHTLAAAGKIYLFHVFGLAQFTEQPHTFTCCKTKNAPEFAA